MGLTERQKAFMECARRISRLRGERRITPDYAPDTDMAAEMGIGITEVREIAIPLAECALVRVHATLNGELYETAGEI